MNNQSKRKEGREGQGKDFTLTALRVNSSNPWEEKGRKIE
jgi:hypothetical protein